METKIKEILEKWGSYVASRNKEALLNLYDEKALLKPTLSQHIRVNKKEIFSYFDGKGKWGDLGFLNQEIIQVEFLECWIKIYDFGSVSMGKYRFLKKDGTKIEAHFTFVFEKNLKIIAHHSSK